MTKTITPEERIAREQVFAVAEQKYDEQVKKLLALFGSYFYGNPRPYSTVCQELYKRMVYLKTNQDEPKMKRIFEGFRATFSYHTPTFDVWRIDVPGFESFDARINHGYKEVTLIHYSDFKPREDWDAEQTMERAVVSLKLLSNLTNFAIYFESVVGGAMEIEAKESADRTTKVLHQLELLRQL